MRNHPDVCKELLEILLEMEIDHIDMHGEEIIETDLDSKSIFENLCREDNSIQLKDRALKYFFIAKNCNKVLNERQKAFLELVTGKKARDQFTRRIEHLAENAIEDAKSFYANGASIELIAKSLKMTEEQIKEIVKDVVVTA